MAMIDWTACSTIERNAPKFGNAWVFRGTRVPVAALFENLADGANVNQFVAWFPGVELMQAKKVLAFAAERSKPAPEPRPSITDHPLSGTGKESRKHPRRAPKPRPGK